MRRSNTQKLSEVLREYVSEMRMDRKLKEIEIVQSWEEVLGKTIGKYTRNIYVYKKVLYVEMTSSVAKNELFIMREEICIRLNKLAGEEIITKIVFK